MKEVFEKIIERLERERDIHKNAYDVAKLMPDKIGFASYARACDFAIEIVKQVAEEYEDKYVSLGAYKEAAWERDVVIEQLHELGYEFGEKVDGWIAFEEEEPPHSDEFLLVQCNGRHRNMFFSNALELASYTESGWYFSAYPEWDNAEVIAWRKLPEPYQPKWE